MKTNPLDGEALFELLTEIVEEIEDDDQWKHLKKHKKKTEEAMGAEDGGKRDSRNRQKTNNREKPPAGQIMRAPEGKPCPNERDHGKCYAGDKGCLAIHGCKDWTGKECTDPCYKKHKICPCFLPNSKKGRVMCKDKHSTRPVGGEAIEAARATRWLCQ